MRLFFAICFVAFAVAACGERDQVLEPQSEKRYQGKPDAKPWDNWASQAIWEEQLKQRQLAQHEDRRIYQ